MYLVQHLPTGQLRAAKCFRTDRPYRQLQELMLIKRLRHPALPQVLDILTYEEQPWLILEYIRGRSIAEIPAESRSAEQFFSVARQLSEVLLYLHTRSSPILHLDVKPSNVLLRPDGSLVLIDFGAAILAAQGEKEGHYGTPGFAAPEQTQPGKRIDVRADIYGFGALLYFYLYGEVPGPSCRTAEGKKRKDCDPAVRKILERCMREAPEERFANFEEVQKEVNLAERRRRRSGQIRKSMGALFLLTAVLLFSGSHLAKTPKISVAGHQERDRTYDLLLERAETLGFGQAVLCYEEALRLCPGQNTWCFLLLDRVEGDCVFDEKEEEAVKQLIYTVPEGKSQTFLEMQKETEDMAYRELAYRLGILYWYFYEAPGGKRAAAKWFAEATQTLKRTEPVWMESARLHARISGYYEKLGKRDERGKERARYSTYWQDLKQLWALNILKKENVMIRLFAAEELLGCILFHMQEICESGETCENVENILHEVKRFFEGEAKEIVQSEPEKRTEQCQEAENAIARIYGK